MKVTPEDVKKLREETGAGIMDCKKALFEVEGDKEKAIKYLKKNSGACKLINVRGEWK